MSDAYHFIGLGGIGMSALARILLKKGYKVRGSDQAMSPILEELIKEGAKVEIGHRSDVPLEQTTVVYGSAIQEGNVELAKAKKEKNPLLHRSDLLLSLMEGKKNLLVTGTHGKTTTTALLSSALIEGDLDPSMVLGGYISSLQTNARLGKSDYFIAEADESDGSFLKTAPFGAIVTNLGRDHLDYWKSEKKLFEGFSQFFSQTKEKKHLFWCIDDPSLASLGPDGVSYGFSRHANLWIFDFSPTEKGISFSLRFQNKNYCGIELSLFGKHNALNAAAAFGLSLSLGVREEAIRRAFREFKGVQRRLEKKGEAKLLCVYDDYGHHPTEIAATLKALRAAIREKRLVVFFQPHRYSRVADLWSQFFDCFDEADQVILTDIYAANESPVEGITSETFYLAMREKLGRKLHFIPKDFLRKQGVQLLKPFDVVLTLGAGDITSLGGSLLQTWEETAPKVKVALLCGGTSAEHDISLMSAKNILKSLDPSFYDVKLFGVAKEGHWLMGENVIQDLEAKKTAPQDRPKISPAVLESLSASDVAIPVFHGPQGEDGMMQAFLDTLQIPYAGCEYRGAVLCMQKGWTKHAALFNNIPSAPFLEIAKPFYTRDPEAFIKRVEEYLPYPVWVKPVHLGSSLGVNRAIHREQLKQAIQLAFDYDESLLVEKEIQGREIEFAVLGNEYIRVINSSEILSQGCFYNYENKYGANAMGCQVPANLTLLEEMVGKDLAKRAYLACGCKGMARVDFFLDRQGCYWLNEINPFPGFTGISAYPKMCEAAGITPQILWNELLSLALHRTRSLRRE